MYKTYFLTTLRSLARNPFTTAVHVVGFGLALAVCLIIWRYIDYEVRFDRHVPQSERVYRVLHQRGDAQGVISTLGVTPPALAQHLRENVPQVELAARIWQLENTLVERGQIRFYEAEFYSAEQDLIEILGIQFRDGATASALTEPAHIAISQAASERYFGTADPVGKTLRISSQIELTVSAVFETVPEQSHFRPEFLASFEMLRAFVPAERFESWTWGMFATYVRLHDGANAASVEELLDDHLAQHVAPLDPTHRDQAFLLQNISDVRHRSSAVVQDRFASTSSIVYLIAFGSVAGLLLVIACINFATLSTARSLRRAKEVGVRKAIGADRRSLIAQFLIESAVLTAVAVSLAMIAVKLSVPILSDQLGIRLPLEFDAQDIFWLAIAMASLAVFAGSYPALVLSSFNPSRTLRGAEDRPRGTQLIRRGLLAGQFMITMALIMCTMVIQRQVALAESLHHTSHGDQLMVINLRSDMRASHADVRREMLSNDAILAASSSWGIPGGIIPRDIIHPEGHEAAFSTNMILADADFVETYGLRIVEGRPLSERLADETGAFLINQSAARHLHWPNADAIGKQIRWAVPGQAESFKSGTVVGVIEDFHTASIHQPIEPLVIHVHEPSFARMTLRIEAGRVDEALTHVRTVNDRRSPEWPLEYTFLDESFASQYAAERRMSRLFVWFAVLAIVIACLGLFGLAAESAVRRQREVGIRKVLGATATSIIALFSTEYIKLIAVAFLLAAPVSFLVMERWLREFAYRTEPSVAGLLAGPIIVAVIALITIGLSTCRTAGIDPAETLRLNA